MKKLAMMIVALAMTVAAQAQYYGYKTTPFHQDKYYIGASVSGLDLHYNSVDDFTLGLNATAGYFVFDNWLVSATAGFNTNGQADDSFSIGGGAQQLTHSWSWCSLLHRAERTLLGSQSQIRACL